MKTKIAGILIFLFGVVGATLLGAANLGSFIHFPSIGYLLIIAGGAALIRYRKGEGKAGFFKNLKKYLIPVGILGFLTGLIQMASHNLIADTINPATLLAGFSVAVLTIFYALLLYCIIDAVVE